MSFKQMYTPFTRQPRRFSSSIKIVCFLLTFIFIIGLRQYFSSDAPWCNPEKSLWWFCPWPSEETVCSWREHFSNLNENNRSPESYEKFFSSLPKRHPSFTFNNATLTQCSDSALDLLIFVISKCSHASIRQSIRRTWANTRLLHTFHSHTQVRVLFLVDNDSKSSEQIILEHAHHHDLVQVTNLPQQYHYVTQRESAIYQFVTERCSQTKFLFKTDDDIFINTFLLLSILTSLRSSNNEQKYSLWGFPIEHGRVVRRAMDSVGERYIITRDEYACPRYPTFLSGFGYLLTKDMCVLFSRAYEVDERPFPLSDVYFTGLLSEMMSIDRKILAANVDYRYATKCNEEFFEAKNNALACAASNDHFEGKQSSDDRSLMNDYNLYWSKLNEKYSPRQN